jgi:predicted phage tail protein
MKFFFKLVFVVLVAGAVAAVVGSIVSKKKLESMSDDEIREFLGVKLAGKVGDDQLVTIQEAVISGVRGKKPTVDHYIEDVEEAIDDLDHVAEDAAEEAADAVHDATEAVTDTVETATE